MNYSTNVLTTLNAVSIINKEKFLFQYEKKVNLGRINNFYVTLQHKTFIAKTARKQISSQLIVPRF